MNAQLAVSTRMPSASHEVERVSTAPVQREGRAIVSGVMTFGASFFAAFTVSLIGEFPLGEFFLIAAAGWALLCVVFNHAWPGPLVRSRMFWTFLVAQFIAFGSYVVADLYRHSSVHDIARGWGRMGFLAIDIIAVAYLFGCARRHVIVFVIGQALGGVASAFINEPLFGDMWKFGIGAPITYGLFLIVPFAGPVATIVVAAALGLTHFCLDYRSLGGICVVAGVLTLLQIVSARFRLWLAPLAMLAAFGGVMWIYGQTQREGRTTRSDIERTSMVAAAREAVEASPLIGHGSWFSNSDVYENFMRIRHEAAREAHVGGFADPNKEPDSMALHSQLLVALAEGGLFGAAFFVVFGGALLWAIAQILFAQGWNRLAPIYLLILLSALWNLLFSPFSGAHRVYIALACGVILVVNQRWEISATKERDVA